MIKTKKPKKSRSREIVQGDLLYHAVHGLCRVDRVTKEKQGPKTVTTYTLVPKLVSKMRVRFVIAETDLVTSGFHSLVSVKEANEILDYLKTGDLDAVPDGIEPLPEPSFAQETQTWSLAQSILSFSQDALGLKDARKRQMLERSARGLLGELSFVFKIPMKETSAKVQKSLKSASRINPLVLAALEQACEE